MVKSQDRSSVGLRARVLVGLEAQQTTFCLNGLLIHPRHWGALYLVSRVLSA